MQVAMLGPLEVRDSSGAVVEVGGARLRAVLIMLALRPGQLVTSGQLIDGLWGEQPPSEPGNALQALVSRLRRAVPEADIASRPAGYQLLLDPEATDVARFERLASLGRTQLRDDPAEAAQTLRAALALWRGPALAGIAEAAQPVIARLEELRLCAVQDRIAADLRLGPDPDRTGQVGTGRDGTCQNLVAELEGLVAAHPMREPLTGLLMRALQASGQRNAALEVYERTRKRLAEQLGADPSAELAALHLELLRAEAPTAPSDAGKPRTNLPAALTSFIGRESELNQVAGLLGVHRLVTLTGPGGAGKTRLAMESAANQLGTMPDGAWLVELAAVTDAAEVAQAVLDALGLREQALLRTAMATRSTDPAGRLIAALASKRMLLVLDNCEHLIDAAAAVAGRVLAACPQVRILATSREPLNITGEALLPVGSLAMAPATMLLRQRARAVSPGLAADLEGAEPALTRICQALDGMPLAIELAAARMRTMGAEQVQARLADRFWLLTGGSRTALPRHQTLRAVVDWSWDLLSEEEQALWRRFAVFTGGATLEAAEQVCAGGPVQAHDVLDLITSLIDKSIITVRPGQRPAGQEPAGQRYSMLEIIRAYGQERLARAGESDQLRAAHAAWFLRLADDGQEHLRGARQLDTLQRFSEDQENLHAALRAAITAARSGDSSSAGTAIALAGSLGWYWYLRSMKAEAADLSAEALTVAGEVTDPERLAIAYTMGGMLAFDTHRFGESPVWLRKAADLADQVPEPRSPVLRLTRPLSLLFSEPQGIANQPEAFDDAVADPDPWVSAIARIIRAQVAINAGCALDQAEADFRAAAATFEVIGERWIGAAALGGGLALMESRRGDFAAAIAHYEQAVELAAEIGSTEDEGHFRVNMARVLWASGQRERAEAELDRALRDAERTGWPESVSYAVYNAGELARLGGQPDQAASYLTRAGELARLPGMAPQLRAAVASARGLLAAQEGDLVTARRLHDQAWELVVPTADSPVNAQVLTGLADLALREGDHERAAGLLARSVTVRGTTDRSDVVSERLYAALEGANGERPEQTCEEGSV